MNYWKKGKLSARVDRVFIQWSLVLSSSVFSLFAVGASSFQSARSPILCLFYLYSFLLHVFSYNIVPPQYLSFGVHPLPSSHYYIFFSLSLHMALPSQSRLSYFLTYVCHTCPCSYFFIPDLLNPLYACALFTYSYVVFCSFASYFLLKKSKKMDMKSNQIKFIYTPHISKTIQGCLQCENNTKK